MNDKKAKNGTLKGLSITLVLITIGILSYYALKNTSIIDENSIKKYGPVIIALYTIVSHIFAPLTASPLMVIATPIIGIKNVVIYTYLGGVVSSIICFYISRNYGRKWVMKLAGKYNMDEIDNLAHRAGTKILIISRLFGLPLFDIISYAFGLTKIEFKTYFLISTLVTIVPQLVVYLSFRNIDFSTPKGIILFAVAIIFVGWIFTILYKKVVDKQ